MDVQDIATVLTAVAGLASGLFAYLQFRIRKKRELEQNKAKGAENVLEGYDKLVSQLRNETERLQNKSNTEGRNVDRLTKELRKMQKEKHQLERDLKKTQENLRKMTELLQYFENELELAEPVKELRDKLYNHKDIENIDVEDL